MSTFPIVEVNRGDTSDIWAVGFQTSAAGSPIVLADLTGWGCKISVRNPDGSVAMAARNVTAKNPAGNRFNAFLTPAETAALTAGDYTVGVQITNPAGDFVKEIHRSLRIIGEAVS